MQKWEQDQLLPLEVRVDMGGRLQLLLMSLQIIEGVVSVSMEMGQQHHWGAVTPPPGLQVRGSGWPGSGALAGGGGGGRICRGYT